MNSKSWDQLRRQVAAAIEESRVIVGHDAFYRTQTMREVLGWMDEIQAPPTPVDPTNRLVCGTGVNDKGMRYEVVRRVRAKEYRVEFLDEPDMWFKVSLNEAVRMVQVPNLGVDGLSAFDRAWTGAHQAA